jgi:CspA family cold shock protein
MTGSIKTLVRERGFGFIAREGEAKDLFFHSKDLNGVLFEELKEGDVVSFDVVQGDKGPSAKGVTRA